MAPRELESAASSDVAIEVPTDPSFDPVEAHQGDFQLAIDNANGQIDAVAFSRADSPSRFRDRDLHIHVVDRRYKYPTWMHPNLGGEARHLHGPSEADTEQAKDKAQPHLLSEWTATAISGNDILSSVLFTTGLTVVKAGKLAPIANLTVVFVVHCLRGVLSEVMSAVPLNGGCYSAILNASTKRVASVSAILSILSYLATGVVCGVAACNYLNTIVEIPVVVSTIAMLLLFMVLCLMGIAESAAVALAFFLLHALTLTILCVSCIVHAIRHPSLFKYNMKTALPDLSVWGGEVVSGNVFTAVFYGYGTALLGVTGFEASAQFVEQQAPGVFPKTLRNMWLCASFFNVAFAVLSLFVVRIDDTEFLGTGEVLLAQMGRITAGRWLEVLVSIDAFIVLAGAVLTSYVGIAGLVQRLAIDRVLPRLLTRTNQCRKTPHVTLLAYFLAASSLVLAMNADISGLSGVFAFAFLGVLGSFVVACFLLKIHREFIPRTITTSWSNCLFCLVMVALGMLANALSDPRSLGYFVLYFCGIGSITTFMLERVWVLKALLNATRRAMEWWKNEPKPANPRVHGQPTTIGSLAIAKSIEKIKRTPAIFFCKTPNLPKINEAISYVMKNEQTYCLLVVHVASRRESILPPTREYEDIVCLFDHIYPSLKIDFVSIDGDAFDSAMIQWIVKKLHVPTNMMFMREPSTPEMHAVAACGVRVITN